MEGEIIYSCAINDSIYTSVLLLRSLDFSKMDIRPTTREAVYAAMRGDHSLSISGANFWERSNQCPFIEKGSLALLNEYHPRRNTPVCCFSLFPRK
jgi:hypothetical protein